MRRELLLSVIVFLASCANAPPKSPAVPSRGSAAASLEEACRTRYTDCRQPGYVVHLRKADGSVFESPLGLTYPPVQDGGMVTIFAGETLHLAAAVDGDRVHLKSAADNGDAQTVTVELRQMEDGAGMMLTISNPFARMLKYRMSMWPLDQDNPMRTTACPVIAHGQGFETWPFPIFQLILADFHLLADDSAELVCD